MKMFFLIITVFLFFQNVYAVDYPAPKYNQIDYSIGEFTVENYYTFPVYSYDKELLDIDFEDSNYSTPEDAFSSFVNSMSKLNKEWFLNSWDKGSKNQIIEEFDEGITFSSWQRAFSDSDIKIIKRIDIDKFIIMQALVDNGENVFVLSHRLIYEEGRWVVTRKYLDHPVVLYYLAGKERVRLPVD